MRMWMIEPYILCRQHLLGEHLECHMFLGALKKGYELDGYVNNNLFELKSLKSRHDALAKEMLRRGYNHNSSLDYPDGYTFGQSQYVVDSEVNELVSLQELMWRCNECNLRAKSWTNSIKNQIRVKCKVER
jgi:hypothetical protein